MCEFGQKIPSIRTALKERTKIDKKYVGGLTAAGVVGKNTVRSMPQRREASTKTHVAGIK